MIEKIIYLSHVPRPTIKFKVTLVDGVTEKKCGSIKTYLNKGRQLSLRDLL